MLPPRVVVLGAHATSGYSMHQHARLLVDAYEQLGVDVRELHPPQPLSRRLRRAQPRKWAAYVEKFAFFWPWLLAGTRDRTVHIADQADAIWVLQLPRSRSVVVTCHDLIAVRAALGELPEHRPRLPGRLYQRLVAAGLRRAGRVLSVSAATADDVERLIGHPPRVTHNPVRRLAPRPPALTVPEDFFLVVSTVSWRKRRDRSVAAWLELRRAFPASHLVVVGPPLTDDERALLGPSAAHLVHQVQGVSDAELEHLYSRCRALLHLSAYEGFGWPVVEANHHGRAAVVTDTAVLREVGGAAVVAVDPSGTEVDWARVAAALSAVTPATAEANAARFTVEAHREQLAHALR